jgi:hypothetical protein
MNPVTYSKISSSETMPAYNQSDIQNMDIDIGQVASKALASLALLCTNSILSVTVGVSKLSGFAVLPTIALTHLTKNLHAANTILAEHAYTPLQNWSKILEEANTDMIDTKVLYIQNERLFFHTSGYCKYAKPMKELLLTSLAVSLWAAAQVLFIVTKPAYLLIVAPGLVCDAAVAGLFALSADVSQLIPDYKGLNELCQASFKNQCSFTSRVYDQTVFSGR